MKPMSKKTNEEIYLEYLNEWLTIKGMADNYNIDKTILEEIIKKGREEHTKNIENTFGIK
jgi:hypothetical protein